MRIRRPSLKSSGWREHSIGVLSQGFRRDAENSAQDDCGHVVEASKQNPLKNRRPHARQPTPLNKGYIACDVDHYHRKFHQTRLQRTNFESQCILPGEKPPNQEPIPDRCGHCQPWPLRTILREKRPPRLPSRSPPDLQPFIRREHSQSHREQNYTVDGSHELGKRVPFCQSSRNIYRIKREVQECGTT